MADYHEERALTEGFRKGENKDKQRLQEPQENPEKRYMLEKRRKTILD